jgi:hypothetical protein
VGQDGAGKFQPGDPRAREAGRAGALKREDNKRKGKTPTAGAGPKDKAPKRPGGSVLGSTARTVGTKTRQRIAALIGTGIVLADETMAKLVNEWDQDKLAGDEVKLLTDAVVGTLLRYPKITRRMEQAAVASELAAVPTALLLIALPRLVRRGLVPKSLATTVSPLLNESEEIRVAAARAEERVNEAERIAADEAERAARRGDDDDDDNEPPAPQPAAAPATPPPLPAEPMPAPMPKVRPPEAAIAAPGQTFKPPPGLS